MKKRDESEIVRPPFLEGCCIPPLELCTARALNDGWIPHSFSWLAAQRASRLGRMSDLEPVTPPSFYDVWPIPWPLLFLCALL